MPVKDFFENAAILQTIEELKNNGVKFDKEPLEEYEEYMDRYLSHFGNVIANEDILFDILKNNRNDFYTYTFHVGYGNGRFGLVMVPLYLLYFAILRNFPDKLEDFMSKFIFKDVPKEARKKIRQYNEAFGIVPEKKKSAPKVKQSKGEKRIISAPLHETGLKYSEYDEDYYAILLQNGKEGNVIINPRIAPTEEKKDGLSVWVRFAPIYKNHKDFRFTDIFREGYRHMLVSERIRKELGDIIPEWQEGIKGPRFTQKCYVKAEEDYLPYYSLYLPSYDFIDKNHMKLIDGSKGIVCHRDSTDGLEDIVYHSFRPGVMAKMPEAERTLFEVDFHSLGWWFCHKSIKEKFEAAMPTGVKFVRSMDMNWWEYNEPARRALREYVNRKD